MSIKSGAKVWKDLNSESPYNIRNLDIFLLLLLLCYVFAVKMIEKTSTKYMSCHVFHMAI